MFSADHHYDPHLSALEQMGQVLSVPRIALGVALYTVGITIENVSEVQRKNFKRKPENKGKVFKGGLFQVCIKISFDMPAFPSL